RQEATERSTRIIIECSGALAYTYYSPDPLTLVVDVPEVVAGSVPSRINVGTREVGALRGRPRPVAERGASPQPGPVPGVLEGAQPQPRVRAQRRREREA